MNYEDIRTGGRIDTQEGQFEQPEVRWTTAASWVKDNWSANVAVNYIGEFEQDASVRVQSDGTILPDIDSMITVDTTVNFIGIENTILTLGATNLFNEEPPFSYHDYMGHVVGTHNSQGRFMYVQATYKF